MRKIGVLQAITGLGVGGAERMVLGLVNSLDAAEFSTRIVSFTPDTQGIGLFGTPGAPHDVIDVKSKPGAIAKHLIGYARLMTTERPDVVHAHMFHALVITLAARNLSSHKPEVIFTSHSADLARGRRAFVWATRLLRHTDVVFYEGQHPFLNARRTVVIPNGVDVERAWQPRERAMAGTPLKFLFVGRLADPKDPIGLLHSFAAARLSNGHLTLAGAGPLDKAVRDTIRTLNLEDRVAVLGLRRDTRELMRAADVFLLHSRREGLPLAVLEAGAEGLPVLSTPVGGVPAVLADGAGYVAEAANYANALIQIEQSRADAIERGKKLYDRVARRYTKAAMVRAHERLYRSVVTNRE